LIVLAAILPPPLVKDDKMIKLDAQGCQVEAKRAEGKPGSLKQPQKRWKSDRSLFLGQEENHEKD
jgi:hypothetical protein